MSLVKCQRSRCPFYVREGDGKRYHLPTIATPWRKDGQYCYRCRRGQSKHLRRPRKGEFR